MKWFCIRWVTAEFLMLLCPTPLRSHHWNRKHRRVRERSRSSSSSSWSSHSVKAEEYPEETEEREESSTGFDKSRLGTKEFTGPNERGRARGTFVSVLLPGSRCSPPVPWGLILKVGRKWPFCVAHLKLPWRRGPQGDEL